MPLIRNVSDTAHWVAMYRALESARPDALFRDPWAERLAGERGREILARIPGGKRWGWPMVVRTAVMDEIVLREVSRGIDTVVCLAAGLDMRPYRLPLPPDLRWVEIDLPAILEEKIGMVGQAPARCRVERIVADLADAGARRDALARAVAGSRAALVMTEGLLIYLAPESVAALAKDLAALPALRLWLLDLAHPLALKWMSKLWGRVVAEGGAPFRFAPEESTRFFEPFGWREREFRGATAEAHRLKRASASIRLWSVMMRFAPPQRRAVFARFSGFVLLERAN